MPARSGKDGEPGCPVEYKRPELLTVTGDQWDRLQSTLADTQAKLKEAEYEIELGRQVREELVKSMDEHVERATAAEAERDAARAEMQRLKEANEHWHIRVNALKADATAYEAKLARYERVVKAARPFAERAVDMDRIYTPKRPGQTKASFMLSQCRAVAEALAALAREGSTR
ncbi:MAG: hypothetical protein AAB973_03350 [Patescibacteria group bacterium]